ncbi:amino acid permease [Arthrobacter echini]|uniref:Amino acid permease n=1 Tax=Arthrobacter echini TaxID=1529066 RepID=A0A4S5E740_9MICC|nr:amino acid permease [Arthrobacter echini]THJ67425.1 amino acid permease [Arthrobacter echini]
MAQPPVPRRVLGGFDATTVGIGSIIGAGAFVVFGPAAAAAGVLLPLAVVIAGFLAYCNATAAAVLAAAQAPPTGADASGREQLGWWAAAVAGWGLLTGRLAACAAAALTVGLHVAPGSERPVAVAAVVALLIVNRFGITRSVLVTRVVIALVLPVLAFVVVVGFASPAAAGSGAVTGPVGVGGVLQGAALALFAFAGYSRIARMGEEVREPHRNIPAVIVGALGVTTVLYLLLSVSLLEALGPLALAETTTPLRDLVGGAAGDGSDGVLDTVVRGAAVLAGLGALLGLITLVGRAGHGLVRNGDLPHALAQVPVRDSVGRDSVARNPLPWITDLVIAAVVVVLVLTTDVVTAISLASLGILVHSAVINIAALTLGGRRWYWPRWLNAVGAVGCVALALALPWPQVLAMLAVLAAGVLLHALGRQGGRGVDRAG